jgi:hypothetical protein
MRHMREIRAVIVGATVVTIYLCLVLMTGRVDLVQFTDLFLTYATGSVTLWLVVGTMAMFVQIFRRMRQSGQEAFLFAFLRESLEARWKRDRGAALLWPPLLFAALIASFNSFKQMVLPIAGFGSDPWLARADRLLFFGHDGWRVTHFLFGSPQATRLIDSLYHGWFLPTAIGVILCAWLPASTYRLRTQYLLSYVAVWIGLGSHPRPGFPLGRALLLFAFRRSGARVRQPHSTFERDPGAERRAAHSAPQPGLSA